MNNIGKQTWEKKWNRDITASSYVALSVQQPAGCSTLLSHTHMYVNSFSTFQATGLCIIVIKNETFKVAMQLKYTVLGVWRHAVSYAVGVLRHPDVRVDSHDPLYRRRPLSTCRLPSVAE